MILAGQSGVGKSSIPQLYAQALGRAEEYLHLPVRPDWLDDRDFVGAFNQLAQRFEPAPSGLVDSLIAAAIDYQTNRGGIYIICLDEMNLARVEYYFSQFLSLLEKPVSERILRLFSQGISNSEDPYRDYSSIQLNENIRFVGTVNIDETTHFFSPKVLDRSQVIMFKTNDLFHPVVLQSSKQVDGITPVNLKTYKKWSAAEFSNNDSHEFVQKLDEIFKKANRRIGHRQYLQVVDYIRLSQPFFDTDTALDYQLIQVVLPRLKRSWPKFDILLEGLTKLISANRFPKAAELIERMCEEEDADFFQLI